MTNDTFKQKFCGSTALKPKKVYTGDQMIGIATMHKSNAQPVFSKQSAQEISRMK